MSRIFLLAVSVSVAFVLVFVLLSLASQAGAPGEVPAGEPGEVPAGAPANQTPKQIADTLVALYGMAMENDEIRSHLPRDIQAAMGKEPFTYEHYDCTLDFCHHVTLFSSGWDHESYLRSKKLDLTDVCLEKYDALIADHEWIDNGTYWGNFLRLCSIWESSRAVEETYRAELSTSISERCLSLIGQGWRLGTNGTFYPPVDHAESLGAQHGLFEDMCLSRSSTHAVTVLWGF